MTDVGQRANLAYQAELYGAPLGDSIRRVTGTLGLSQAGVARVLGVSAPMLSQLVSGQRIKIGNPLVVQRLQSLLELAEEVERGLAHDLLEPRLEEIRSDVSSTLTRARPGTPATEELAAAFGRLLRAVASGRELAGAADVLQEEYPELAAVLRAYGTGRPEDARRHFAAVAHLL